jgi:hypothetical protein
LILKSKRTSSIDEIIAAIGLKSIILKQIPSAPDHAKIRQPGKKQRILNLTFVDA